MNAEIDISNVKLETERQVTVFRKMLRFTAFLAFPAMFGLSMVAHEFIIVLISDKWADSIPLLRILCISGAFLPFYTLYQNLMISRGKSDVYLWITTSLIAVQLLLVLLCYTKGMIFMVSEYTVATVLWLFVWQVFAYREISIRLYDVLCDIIPYMFISAVIIIVVYFATSGIQNLIVLLLTRIILAIAAYFITMKLLGFKILDECINYLFHKKIKS